MAVWETERVGMVPEEIAMPSYSQVYVFKSEMPYKPNEVSKLFKLDHLFLTCLKKTNELRVSFKLNQRNSNSTLI